MNLENRLKSDKKILLASILLMISILSSIIHACIMPFAYVGSIIGNVISRIPNVLFLIHTLVFYKTEKPQKLFTVSYALLLIFSALGLLQGAEGAIIRNILFVLSYGLMVYLSLKGTKSRILSLIGIIIPCLLNLLSLIQMFSYGSWAVSYWGTGYLWMNLISYVGSFAFYAALFIIVPDTIKIKNDEKLTPSHLLEEELVKLKQQYENGKITEQEYNDSKKELLNSL